VKSEKELAKKELQAKCAVIKGHEVANRSAKKELDWQKRQYKTLAKVHSNLVASNSELAASLVDVIAVKTKLLATSTTPSWRVEASQQIGQRPTRQKTEI
jgi:hypothetical protein